VAMADRGHREGDLGSPRFDFRAWLGQSCHQQGGSMAQLGGGREELGSGE
jgi:hypothetical protein